MLEVFFDYGCPYCLKGHENLKALLPQYPGLEIAWMPCEAHPRPEQHGMHSDLCVQGFFFAQEHGVDLWAYHAHMYKAALVDRINIEDIDTLAASVRDLLDADAFRQALEQGTYAKQQLANNDYAYEKSGVWAVPAYRMDGRRLDAVEGIGVGKKELAAFLEEGTSR